LVGGASIDPMSPRSPPSRGLRSSPAQSLRPRRRCFCWLSGRDWGLISTSPWPGSGASAGAITALAAIWLIAVQWIASGLGGYLTGRLRTKWVGTHTHEVFFRDTAHGFVTWALATVVLAVLIAAAAASAVRHRRSGGRNPRLRQRRTRENAANAVSRTPRSADMTSTCCFAHRSLTPANRRKRRARGGDAHPREGLTTGDVAAADRAYVAQMIAARTGIAQPDAERRVDDVVAQLNCGRNQGPPGRGRRAQGGCDGLDPDGAVHADRRVHRLRRRGAGRPGKGSAPLRAPCPPGPRRHAAAALA
jgi:hypothetical protein